MDSEMSATNGNEPSSSAVASSSSDDVLAISIEVPPLPPRALKKQSSLSPSSALPLPSARAIVDNDSADDSANRDEDYILHRSYCQRLWPPFFKYPIFLYGFTLLLYMAVQLSVAEQYYKSASLLFPVLFAMLDESVALQRRVQPAAQIPTWDPEDKEYLETYRHGLAALWVVATVGIVLLMLSIIPQFFEFIDRRGNPSHLCLVRRHLAWVFFYLFVALVVAQTIVLSLFILRSRHAKERYSAAMDHALHSEKYLNEFEKILTCTIDDDKEVSQTLNCYTALGLAVMREDWILALGAIFAASQLLTIPLIPLLNKQLIEPDDEFAELMNHYKN